MVCSTANGAYAANAFPLPRSAIACSVLLTISVLALPVAGDNIAGDNWPGWRGGGSGISEESGLPVHWSPTENILWKTRIDGSGISSPIVWDNRVFVTTAVTRPPLWYAPTFASSLATAALLFVLVWLILARKDHVRRVGTQRLFRPIYAADRLGTMLALSLYAAGTIYLYSKRDDFGPGAESMAWSYAGAVGILAVMAAVGLFDPRSRWRLLGSGVLVATLVLYLVGGSKDGVSTKLLLVSGGGLCVSAWWCLLFFLSPTPRDESRPSRRAAIWQMGGSLAILLSAAVQCVMFNCVCTAGFGESTGAVICLDRNDGAILWRHRCFHSDQIRKNPHNSFATPTPVTDGQRVVARFGPGLVCLDFEGNVQWQRTIPGYLQHHHVGAAISPVMFEDSVIYVFLPDGLSPRSNDALSRYSRLTALDMVTGDVKWQVALPGGHDSYNTPLLVHVADRPVLLIATWDHLLAFDPRDGTPLHCWDLPVRQCIPSMVADQHRVYVMSGRDHGSQGGFAVELTAEEEGSQPAVAWKVRRDSADIASPVLSDGLLYMVTTSGRASCLDADSGDLVWKERLGGMFYASVVAGDGKAYFTSLDGETTVIRLGREYEELAKNTIGEGTSASPAIAAGKLFIRGDEHLFCIGTR